MFFPPHLYGELTKSNEGCELMRHSGHFEWLINTAFDREAQPLHRRAALVALVFHSLLFFHFFLFINISLGSHWVVTYWFYLLGGE